MTEGTDISKRKLTYKERTEGDFPDRLVIELEKEWDLKYGENPGQHAAIYALDIVREQYIGKMAELTNIQSVRSDGKGKGGLSLTNTMDISRAMDNLKFYKKPTFAILKHTIISGFATQTSEEQSPVDLFRLARDSDLRSNFGGTVTCNIPLTKELAEAYYELHPTFFPDVIAAPGYDDGVVSMLEQKSANVRIAEFSHLSVLPKFEGDNTYGLVSIKEMPGGRVGIQDVYLTAIKGPEDLIVNPKVVRKKKVGEKWELIGTYVVERKPTIEQLYDLVIAWWLNIAGARSNGVVAVKDGVLVSMGSGQVERVGAVEQMIVKGMQKAMDREGIKYDPLMGINGYGQISKNPFEGASVSSDAFFPFGDSIESLGRVGVGAVVQPFGSMRDYEVIEAANKCKIAMVASDRRCFGHF